MKKSIKKFFQLTFVILILSSCTTYNSKYKNTHEPEKNQIQKFDQPYLKKELNIYGWGLNIGISAGTGILAYNFIPVDGTKKFLNGNGINSSDNGIRLFHGISTSAIVFLADYLITTNIDPIKQVVTTEDAVSWVKHYNQEFTLVEFAKDKYIRSIPNSAAETFEIKNLNDAKLYAQLFQSSPFANQVVTKSLYNLSNEDIPQIISIFPTIDISSKLQSDIILESKNIQEWITNTSKYPGKIKLIPDSLIQVNLGKILMKLEDIESLQNTGQNYISEDFIYEKSKSLIFSVSDIELFNKLFPNNKYNNELEKNAIDLIKSYSDIVAYKKLYPSSTYIDELDSKAYKMINSLEDVRLYFDNFRNSKNSEKMPEITLQFVNSGEDIINMSQLFANDSLVGKSIDKLLEKLSNIEILKIIDSVPFTNKYDELKEKFYSNLKSLDDVIQASEKFPDDYEFLAIEASQYCQSLVDYRKYFATFGDAEIAESMRKKYYDVTSKEPENLGKNVNSEIGEYAPVITPDGETLYFTRRDSKKYSDDEEIYVTTLGEMDQWSEAINIGAPLNNSKHNAVSGVSQDGSMLLLHNHYYDNDPGLAVSYITSEGWSTPEDIYIPDFYNNSEYHNACLSADGNTILISSARDDSFGGNDLYFVQKDTSGNWSSPQNLGSVINTSAEESSVFLAADGVTIYFSSDGYNGFGGSDIYMSRRLDNTWTNWSKPVNLGDKINTINSERYYVIPASGDYVYFSSYNNSIGQSDIFRIGLPLDKRPKPVVLVSGKVINKKTNEPVAAKIYYEDLVTGEKLGVVNTNPKIGNYKIILPGGRKYAFRAESEGFLPINENVDLEQLHDFKKKMKDLEIVPFEKGQSLTINNLFFETGSANLKKESCFELDRLVKHMKDNPNLIIEVSGHTDNVGADEMNMDLSIRRAKAVCNYLNKNGIAKGRLRYFGFGETKPVVPNNSAANRQKNRRVEVKFVEA